MTRAAAAPDAGGAGLAYREALVHGAVLPHHARFAGVARPPDLLRVPARADDVDAPVTIHVERQVAEGRQIRAVLLQSPHNVLFPSGVLVPGVAGKNVRASVAVEIGDGTGLADAEVERLALKRNLRAARRQRKDCRKTYHRCEELRLAHRRIASRLIALSHGRHRQPWGALFR